MGNLSKLHIALGIFVVLALSLIVIGIYTPSGKRLGGGIPFNIFASSTPAGVTCANNSSSIIIATSSQRSLLKVSNLGPVAVYLNLGVPAEKYKGIFVGASTTIDLSDPVWTGAVTCIGDGGAASTTVQEAL